MNDHMPRSGDSPATGSDARDSVRQKAADLAEGAKEQAREQYDRQKGMAMGELDSLASALRRAGSELGDDHGMSSRVVNTVANRIETFSRSLDGKDLDRVVGDLETFARRNTAAFLGGAVAVGFLAARFLKSGTEDSYGSSRDRTAGFSTAGTSYSGFGNRGTGMPGTGYGINHATDSGIVTPGTTAPSPMSGAASPSTSGTGVTGTSSPRNTGGIVNTATETGNDPLKGRR